MNFPLTLWLTHRGNQIYLMTKLQLREIWMQIAWLEVPSNCPRCCLMPGLLGTKFECRLQANTTKVTGAAKINTRGNRSLSNNWSLGQTIHIICSYYLSLGKLITKHCCNLRHDWLYRHTKGQRMHHIICKSLPQPWLANYTAVMHSVICLVASTYERSYFTSVPALPNELYLCGVQRKMLGIPFSL